MSTPEPVGLPTVDVPNIWGPLWAERGEAIVLAQVEAARAEDETRWLLSPS